MYDYNVKEYIWFFKVEIYMSKIDYSIKEILFWKNEGGGW